jgi:hypothetical protein
MRLVIGVVGVLLPVLLVVVDGVFLDAPVTVRGSMSAYYHSSARDLFVGGLAVSGVMLATYMFWNWWTWDFVISFVAGIAVLGVAAFPTGRPRQGGESVAERGCTYVADGVPPCTALQDALGEGVTRTIHGISAAFVVVTFATLCIVFALRDFGYGVAAHKLVGEDTSKLGPRNIWKMVKSSGAKSPGLSKHLRSTPRAVLYVLCFLGVVVGGVWAKVGPEWVFPHNYSGEFIAFTAFGAAWIVASWDLLRGSRLIKAVASQVNEVIDAVTPPPTGVADPPPPTR